MFLPLTERKNLGLAVDSGNSRDGIQHDGDAVAHHVQGEYFAVGGAEGVDVGFLTEEEGDCDAYVRNEAFDKGWFRGFRADEENMVEISEGKQRAEGKKRPWCVEGGNLRKC